MAHSKHARCTMFDWIEQCLNAGTALPTDAQIVDHYCFTSPEQARTLLAELADAGRITIRGYGDDRVITLGRTKSVAAGFYAPIAPTIKRADPVVEKGVARIAAILARTKSAVPTRIAAEAAIVKPEQPALVPPREEAMSTEPSRKIEFTGEAMRLIEERAAAGDLPFKTAAAELIEQSAKRVSLAPAPSPSPSGILSICTIDDLLGELRARFEAAASAPDLSADLAAASSRAEAAEARLAQAKALFA